MYYLTPLPPSCGRENKCRLTSNLGNDIHVKVFYLSCTCVYTPVCTHPKRPDIHRPLERFTTRNSAGVNQTGVHCAKHQHVSNFPPIHRAAVKNVCKPCAKYCGYPVCLKPDWTLLSLTHLFCFLICSCIASAQLPDTLLQKSLQEVACPRYIAGPTSYDHDPS